LTITQIIRPTIQGKINIPSNIIPFLIELLQIHWKRATYGDHDDGPSKITVRQAMWISTIWSSVGKLVERYKKDDEIPDPAGHRPKYFIFSPEYASKAIPFLVAQLYAEAERISEILGNKYFDTRAIDEIVFLKEYQRYSDFFSAIDQAYLRISLIKDTTNNVGIEDTK